MQPFKYTHVTDIPTAITTLHNEQQAVFVAGGTSLIDLMKLDVQTPVELIDINALPLTEVGIHDNGVRIGALARNSDVAANPIIKERYPVLSEALLTGASPQLRNMATMGGNLLQRTRCPYFRDTAFPCNKREPGSGCSAIDGYNRQHAILGTSPHCIATHPSDMCVALATLDATIYTSGPQGERTIPFEQFYFVPDDHPQRETVLEHGELITGIELPILPFAQSSIYIKVRDRAAYAFAIVSVAAALDIEDGSIRHARIALGGVATKPWRAYDAEYTLVGQAPTQENYEHAAKIAMQGAVMQKDNAFKVELTQRTIVHALERIAARGARGTRA